MREVAQAACDRARERCDDALRCRIIGKNVEEQVDVITRRIRFAGVVEAVLLHADEIRKLIGKVEEKGMTLVPVRMYFKNGRVKVAVSLAKGKKDYDKRETIKRREVDRETRAAIKSSRR